ncbi:MAG: hypothetical protein ACE5PT_02120 [Gemmatimonadales bacterium]
MSVALDRRVERDALPTLERELLLSLGILVGAALSVAVIAALIAQLVAPTYAVVLLPMWGSSSCSGGISSAGS